MLKIKTAQAQSDKIELMRDLATYENKVAEEIALRSVYLRIHKQVLECKKKLERINAHKGEC